MILFLLALLAMPLCQAQPKFTLPDGVTPRRHEVEMTIDPARDSFTGVVKIEVTMKTPQATLWVNGKDLTVAEASITVGGKALPAKTTTAEGEFIGLTPSQPVSPGNATIMIRYKAALSAQATSGPFRKKVEDEWYQYTVFTPIDARRAFPCFDEPRFKTPWQMALRVRREHRAFSNAPMVSETNEPDGMKLVRFAPTQALPAEVVAFAVGPFDVFDGGTAGGKATPVRVITPKGQAEQGRQAALATQEVLPRLERYTGIPYPWEKLDHIALPQGAFGAVENPGLITYLARNLLVLPAEANDERRRPVRQIQTHEIGHQWFGNLVTQGDWIDVWLSEGFATWITAKMMDQEQPADRKRLTAVVARERIMATDEAAGSHPIRWVRQSREELKSVYNQIAYQKGGAVLLMLEGWLGEDRFQQSIRKYLAAHRMGNATTGDLQAALRSTAAADPTPVVDGFLNNTGVPVIKARLECDFARLILEKQKGTAPVPVCWKTPATLLKCNVIGEAGTTIPMGSVCPEWIYLNANGTGYYRTAWTGAQLEALEENGLSQLTGSERLTLVYDLRALRPAAKLGPRVTDPLLNRLAKDVQPEIARAARVALGLETEPAPRKKTQ